MNIMIPTLILLSVFDYFNLSATLWFVAGGLFAIVNLYFIKKILYELLIVNPKNLSKIILLGLIKFPLLYGVSFSLLYYQEEISWTLLAGFIITLALSAKKMFSEALELNKGQAA